MTNVDDTLRSLDLASSRAKKRLLLIPELVEAALARLGERQLSLEGSCQKDGLALDRLLAGTDEQGRKSIPILWLPPVMQEVSDFRGRGIECTLL